MFPWLGVVMEQSTFLLWRTLGEHPWLCSLRTKPRRGARCQRRCATFRRLMSVQARSFSGGVCWANLPGQPEVKRHNDHSAGSRGLDVLCERVRHVADSVSEPRGSTRHRANRSCLANQLDGCSTPRAGVCKCCSGT